jgi:hypothetical protein
LLGRICGIKILETKSTAKKNTSTSNPNYSLIKPLIQYKWRKVKTHNKDLQNFLITEDVFPNGLVFKTDEYLIDKAFVETYYACNRETYRILELGISSTGLTVKVSPCNLKELFDMIEQLDQSKETANYS